mmetsp:Transcript_61985/g.166086  ORF Transcript_61985/g.166086 Transcript_61985/m.166086 type:complete len:232 (+) Transcript_61985:903-1598(+)
MSDATIPGRKLKTAAWDQISKGINGVLGPPRLEWRTIPNMYASLLVPCAWMANRIWEIVLSAPAGSSLTKEFKQNSNRPLKGAHVSLPRPSAVVCGSHSTCPLEMRSINAATFKRWESLPNAASSTSGTDAGSTRAETGTRIPSPVSDSGAKSHSTRQTLRTTASASERPTNNLWRAWRTATGSGPRRCSTAAARDEKTDGTRSNVPDPRITAARSTAPTASTARSRSSTE